MSTTVTATPATVTGASTSSQAISSQTAAATPSVDATQLKEYRFLSFVTSGANAVEGDPKSVLSAIDKYGWQQEWAMNLGDVKGRVVESILKSQLRTAANAPVVGLELGAYMGYSAVHFSSLLPQNSLFLSVELNPLYAAIASKMLEFALTNADHGPHIQNKVLIGTLTQRAEDIRKIVRRYRNSQSPSHEKSQLGASSSAGDTSAVDVSFDFIFIDHWKAEYVSDFLLLEKLGFIGRGTVIIADNIIYPGAPEYLALLTGPEKSKDYDSKLHHSQLEYSDKQDAILVSVRK